MSLRMFNRAAMKKLITSFDITILSFYQSLLKDNKIETILKNYYLSGGVGDLPANEIVPELWIIDDEQYEAALNLLKEQKHPTWKCVCGEKIGGTFSQCWKCGKLKEN